MGRRFHPRPRRLLTGLAAAAAGAALVASPGGAATGKTETLRLFEKTRSIQLTKADGRVLDQLPIAEPQPGDVLDAVFDLHPGDHAKHGKTRLGSDHLRCEFVAGGPPKCVSHATIGRSMLVVEGTPPRITLGTGRYAGATGRVISAKEVKQAPPSELAHNDIDVVAKVTLK
ncbi:hypothetical protein DVA67_017120 [Solirubrobacter sp. CPCC 204708]|uniref:Uncharacterized protein n=1 Tax=Solirubrobacter deserti TaxID=2282478 RepID=A0ABT4RJD1_9ACTN|nr:hypothetical protein [Solirubrobacter deserti]MBE2317706.1 hypothetical protein [Solirubrobacter deserti]MDA0138657.1 hypothetical protein [Solirubrobacter deserti]